MAQTLPREVQRALESRRAEIDRMQAAAGKDAVGSQILASMPASVRVELGSILEARTSIGTGTLAFQLLFPIEQFPSNAFVRRIEARAVDEQGKALVPSAVIPAATIATLPMQAIVQVLAAIAEVVPAVTTAPLSVGSARLLRTVMFQVPPRRTEAIKAIEGELEIVVPSEESGSLVLIPELGRMMGKPLEHAALAKQGVEITSLTKEMYNTLRPTWMNSAAATTGTSATATNPTAAPDFTASAVFLLKDANRQFVTLELRNATGTVTLSPPSLPTPTAVPMALQVLPTNAFATYLIIARYRAPLPADAQLRIVLAAPAALKVFSYRLENVKLP